MWLHNNVVVHNTLWWIQWSACVLCGMHIQHFTLRKATVYMSYDGFLLEKDMLDF